MARKSKASTAETPAEAAIPPTAIPAAPAGLGRRTSRRTKSKVEYTEDGTDDEAQRGEAITETKMNGKTVAPKRAIEDIGTIDDNSQGPTKRKRLQMEETSVTIKAEEDDGIIEPLTNGSAKKTPRRKKKAAPVAVGRDISGGEDEGYDDDVYVASDGAMEDEADPAVEVAERGAARPPAINSSYLPLPWKGRIGYACLNTYLRAAKPSVFCSRTCRMASIVEHRHPLQDPSQPEHAIKNRPDKSLKADMALGHNYVQDLGLTNAKDLVKMLRWNDKYNIKFMRLSSEMFPFASHPEHGYSLAPFASEVLGEAGKVVAELGHRVSMHPGQFTQLGSPRKEVIVGSVRDLQYHDELLGLLKLPDQQNRDAVMIIHMGGVFGDKAATLDRFRENYTNLLTPSIKARLVLENDDVSWSVHELLPVCEELNIPMVLDFHHHNIVFDPTKVREGTLDIAQPELMDRILATWHRKGIKPKMHYSEQCAGTVTPRDRRKHSPRVMTLPPCPPDMDLMIEAKDKEQAVFELMRTFKLPGFEKINDMIPHERDDEDRPPAKVSKGKNGGKKKKVKGSEAVGVEESVVKMDVDIDAWRDMGRTVTAEEFAMGGKNNRVYWPLGRDDWLKPKKREGKVKVGVEEE